MSRGWSKHALVREMAADVLHELMPVAPAGEAPVELTGWRDHSGALRRAVAVYANGWRIDIRLSPRGEVTSTKATIRLVARGGQG